MRMGVVGALFLFREDLIFEAEGCSLLLE